MKMFAVILLLIHFKVTEVLRIEQHNFLVNELRKYKNKYEECNKHRVTCFYTDDGSSISKDISLMYLSEQKMCTTLIWTHKFTETARHYHFTSQEMFVFFEKVENIIDNVLTMINYTFFLPETRVHFILCTAVTSTDFLYRVLHNIWEQRVYKFVFVIVDEKYKVFTFNNLVRKKISLVDPEVHFCEKLFPDKIKNLEGSLVRVSVFEKIPIGNWNEETGRFEGSDIEVMNLFAQFINCSLKIFGKFDSYGAVDSLRSNESEITFVAILQVDAFPGLDYSYPVSRDDRVIIVPISEEMSVYHNVLRIFDKLTWFLLLMTILILPTIFFSSEEKRTLQTWLNHYQNFWALTLNISFNLFMKTKNKLRWLMLVWIWAALIITTGFQSAMYGSLLKATHEKEVNTLEDLKESGMTIYIHRYFIKTVRFEQKDLDLRSQYISSNYTENIRRLKTGEKAAFIVSREMATMIMNHFIHTTGEPVYRLAEYIFLTGLRMFHMQKNSPFLEKINEFLLKLDQSGLRKQDKYSVSEKPFSEARELNLKQLNFIFTIYLFGNVLAIFVFVCELVCNKLLPRGIRNPVDHVN